MKINGVGITEAQVKVQVDFQPKTDLALQWKQLSNGNWVVTDRGVDSDIYETKVRVAGRLSVLNNIIDQIYANRVANSNEVSLSDFADNEHIFGEDVVHTGSIAAVMMDTPTIKQKSLRMFTMDLIFRALSPTFTGSETVPDFKYLNNGYDANVDEWMINRIDSYENDFTYQDHKNDVGLFKGTFLFPISDMRNLRRYMATQRGVTAEITDIRGVTNPFGPTRGTYPVNVKILNLENEEMRDLKYWKATITLAEVV